MSNKHDANVRKSALVNFQIGLIASLLLTYVVFELYTTERTDVVVYKPAVIEEQVYVWNPDFRVHVEPKSNAIVQKRIAKVVDPHDFEVVPDTKEIAELGKTLVDVPSANIKLFDTSTLESVDESVDDIAVTHPFTAVEDVPVFPGCEGLKTNKEKAACFNEKIQRIISRKFNADIGSRYGLSGDQRIYTVFDVSSDGTIQNVQVRAPHPKLQKEAERVIGLFPKMKPGMQRKKPVTVKYQLPIMFRVQD